MKFIDIESILKTSNPKDWLFDSDVGIYTYKLDVRLNILTKHPELPEIIEFKEDWLHKFSSSEAWLLFVKVYFSGSFVKKYEFVQADGDRIIIGMPKSEDKLVITPLQYNMGKILSYQNIEANLSDYDPRFKISGFEVKKV